MTGIDTNIEQIITHTHMYGTRKLQTPLLSAQRSIPAAALAYRPAEAQFSR